MELCPRMAAKVARSIPASAIRVANVWRKSYRTKLKSIPAFFAALQRLSCAFFRRAMCCPGLRSDGNIHAEFPGIRAASIRLLSDVRSSVLRAAGDLPHPDLKLPALQIDIAFRQRRDLLGAHSLKYHQPPQLMADAHRRNFDAVLVWKIDRFGRLLKHLVNALADLGAYGVAFISCRNNLDLSTPSGRLMFQIIGAMAEFERSLIQERVRAGLRNARAKGKKFGRPRVQIDGVRVAELRRGGLSWSQVCRTLSVSKGTAQRAVADLPNVA